MTRGMAVALLLVLVLTAIRLVSLDSDPPFTKRVADVPNEGYWLHNARMKALTGDFRHDHFNQALVTAPLFTALAYAAFALAGVGLASGRLVSAVSGALLILLGYLYLWRGRRDLPWATAFALLLGINDLFFAYNRIALVETTLALLLFASFIALAAASETRRAGGWLYVSGVCFGLALLVKFTALYVAASFVLAVAVEWLAGNRRSVVAYLLWGVGVATAVLPVMAAIEAFYPGELRRHIAIYSSAGVAGGSLYQTLVPLVFNPLRVIRNEFVTTLSVGLLVVMLAVGLVDRVRRARGGLGGVLAAFDAFERVCLAWIAGNVLTAAVADLQADRRYWTVLVPLVVVVARMVVLAARRPSHESPAPAEGPADSVAARFALGALAMYALAPLLVAGAQSAGDLLGVAPRLGFLQAASLVAAGLVAGAMVWRAGTGAVWYLLLVPLIAFTIEWNVGLFVPAARGAALSVVAGAGLGVLATRGLLRARRHALRPVLITLVALYAIWDLGVVGQALAFPQATIPAAARDVDRIVARVERNQAYYVAGANAHELALESRSFPIFLGIGRFYTDLSRELERYPAIAPQYFLESLGTDARGAIQLPRGVEGTVLGTYCGLRDRLTQRCARWLAVVKVTRFSITDFLAAAKVEESSQ